MDVLDKSVVEQFRNTIMLWCAVRSESTLRALLSKEFGEGVAGVLSTTV